MPSGWTESGIDWDNLSTQSFRDVVRELYIATSEKDHWIRYFGTGGFIEIDQLPPIDYNATELHRTKDQLHYIMTTMSFWLESKSDFYDSRSVSDRRETTYRGCFIDYSSGSDYSFDGYGRESDLGYAVNRNFTSQEELTLGYNTYTYDENGSLEVLIDSSLKFFREYNGSNTFRFTFEMMKSIYDILNTLNYTKCVSYQRTTIYNTYSNTLTDVYFGNTYFKENGVQYGAYITQRGGDPSFNVARQEIYDDLKGTNTGNTAGADFMNFAGGNFSSSESWGGGTGLASSTRTSLTRFKNTGYNGNLFTTTDFDLKSLVYGLQYRNDTIIQSQGEQLISEPDYTLTSRPSGHSIIDNNIVNLTNTPDLNLNFQGDYWALSYGNIVDGDIPDSVENVTPVDNRVVGTFPQQYLPLIDFNKEGFLKYYTPPTN